MDGAHIADFVGSCWLCDLFLSALALGIPEFRICGPIILKYLRFGTQRE